MAPVLASVIVRSRNEAATIERTLRTLGRQTVRPEIIVVDSGSTDGTVEIARVLCDTLIEIPQHDFTYGYALNIGARAARAPVHFALSAHCFAERRDWVERSLAHYANPRVAGTNGIQTFTDGRPVIGTFLQDVAHARRDPFWGYSNHASSWRASVLEAFPFDEGLDYAEDREWSWRVMDAGYLIAFDPTLWVDLSHSWRGGAGDLYRRQMRAGRALSSFAPLPSYGLAKVVREWWGEPPDDRHSAWFHRLNYRRVAGLAGKYVGRRPGRGE